MHGSNLPPGVTESMIPGNRPEDIENEAWWDRFYEKYPSPKTLGESEFNAMVDWIRGDAYAKGMEDGRGEIGLLQHEIVAWLHTEVEADHRANCSRIDRNAPLSRHGPRCAVQVRDRITRQIEDWFYPPKPLAEYDRDADRRGEYAEPIYVEDETP